MASDVMRVRLHLREIRVLAVASDTPSELRVEVESTVRRPRCPACGFRCTLWVPEKWREGTSPSRSLRTVRDSLPSYGSHSPAFFCLGRSVGSSPEGLTSKRP